MIHIFRSRPRAQGMALPVMLIILAVMMVASIYMLRATHATALATSSLAYDASISRSADYGLHYGFQQLQNNATATTKAGLNNDQPAWGYSASWDATQQPTDSGFWTNKITIPSPDNLAIDYVIHRLCSAPGDYSSTGNACMQTVANTGALGNAVALGASLAADTPQYAGSPQLHYVISARIHGARGALVINQLIVLIGA